MTQADLQTCTKCKTEKPISEFYFRADAQNYRRVCKVCYQETNHRYYYADHEKTKASNAERLRRARKEHPERNPIHCRKWRASHKEHWARLVRKHQPQRVAYLKKWRERNREKYNAYMRRYNAFTGRVKENRRSIEDKLEIVLGFIPPGFPVELRDDLSNELIVAFLEGNLRISKMAEDVKGIIKRFNKRVGRWDSFKSVSLDAPVPGTDGLSYGDMLEG